MSKYNSKLNILTIFSLWNVCHSLIKSELTLLSSMTTFFYVILVYSIEYNILSGENISYIQKHDWTVS